MISEWSVINLISFMQQIKWLNTQVGQTHSWMTTFYFPSKYKYVYININWSVYEVYRTTETGLPLFTNTDLEFVFNLNID